MDIPGLLQTLNKWDAAFYIKINATWIHPWADTLMPVLRYPETWIPFYALLLFFILYKFGWKSWPWIVMAALAPALGDIISSHFIKEWVGRMRPCNEPALVPYARELLNYCPGNGSFTSSHAANHFSMATYFYFTLKRRFDKGLWLFFAWAAAICYAQVYVGVHYPGDVLGGAVLGMAIGGSLAYIFNKKIGLPHFRKAGNQKQ